METHTQRNPRGQRALVGNHPLPAEHVSTTGDNIGRACAIQACVCRLWRYVLWLNGATIDRLYEVVYEKSIDEQNEWPWPLFRGRLKVTASIALHLTLNILETVRDRGLVP